MIKLISLFFLLLTFNACSFKTPHNDWQYKSTSAFSSYTKNFLSAHDPLAKNDLKRSIAHAKMSSNLYTLASIYLGECALNIAVGTTDDCQKYAVVSDLVNDAKLNSYYRLLTNKLEEQDIHNLPKDYQDFSKYFLKKDFLSANDAIRDMQKVSSQLIAIALLDKDTNDSTRKFVLEQSSEHGYKKAVLYILKKQKEYADKNETIKIDTTIKILQSKD